MQFKVTILGSGAAIPTVRRGTTAHYLFCQNRHLLIDCGEGTQIQLRKFKIKFQQIQIILISHLHGDHVLGLPGLISTMQLLGRTTPLAIFGPKGLRKFLLTILNQIGKGVAFPLHIHELENESSEIIYEDNCITIKNFPLNHRVIAHGYLVKEKPHKRRLLREEFDKTGVSVAYIQKLIQGFDITDNVGNFVRSDDVTIPGKSSKSYAFCSDTSYFPDIIPHIKGADLLYHEATFLDKEADRAAETFHATAKQAATIAQKAQVKKLILGHFSARYLDSEAHVHEAKTIFSNVCSAEDGETYVL